VKSPSCLRRLELDDCCVVAGDRCGSVEPSGGGDFGRESGDGWVVAVVDQYGVVVAVEGTERTVTVTYSYLSTVLKEAVENRRIARTPCVGIKLPGDRDVAGRASIDRAGAGGCGGSRPAAGGGGVAGGRDGPAARRCVRPEGGPG